MNEASHKVYHLHILAGKVKMIWDSSCIPFLAIFDLSKNSKIPIPATVNNMLITTNVNY